MPHVDENKRDVNGRISMLRVDEYVSLQNSVVRSETNHTEPDVA